MDLNQKVSQLAEKMYNAFMGYLGDNEGAETWESLKKNYTPSALAWEAAATIAIIETRPPRQDLIIAAVQKWGVESQTSMVAEQTEFEAYANAVREFAEFALSQLEEAKNWDAANKTAVMCIISLNAEEKGIVVGFPNFDSVKLQPLVWSHEPDIFYDTDFCHAEGHGYSIRETESGSGWYEVRFFGELIGGDGRIRLEEAKALCEAHRLKLWKEQVEGFQP